jgi:hypothetical protein
LADTKMYLAQQGTLIKGKDAVQLTSLLRWLVLK